MVDLNQSVRRWLRRGPAGETAQALIETSIAVALLVPLTIGAAEFARLAYAGIEVSNAARAAVQYGAQNGSTASDTTGIQTAAAIDAADIATTLTTTVATSCVCSDGSASTCQNTDCPNSHIEETLSVTTATTVDPMIHLPGIPRTITLHGLAIQKVLQ